MRNVKTVLTRSMVQSRKGDVKMKKCLALIGMITCILGLSACGGTTLTDYEQTKVDYAKQMAAEQIIPFFESLVQSGGSAVLSDYTAEEVEYQIGSSYNMNVDGYAVIKGVSSFESAYKEIGSILSVGEATASIDGNQIIVLVQVDGEKKDAEAEIIFSNDMFMNLESAALNPSSSMGELMEKAALNTLIGMGTVFIVLILISGVISAFKVIPVIQAKFTKKPQEEKKEAPAVQASAAPAVEEAAEEADDLELVAVIAAAIAASEGAASADGFVVRSIRKVNRRR